MTNDQFIKWLEERNAAVQGLDLKKFKAFYRKWMKLGAYESPMPDDTVVEWAMCLAALQISTTPLEVRQKASKRLTELRKETK